MPDERIRVVIVDDHGIVRHGLRSYLATFDDLEIVGDAPDGQAALAVIRQLQREDRAPRVVLMDLAMERMDGVSATREVRAQFDDIEVVAVTSFPDDARVQAALDAGASGYVIRTPTPRSSRRRSGRPIRVSCTSIRRSPGD